MGAIMLSPSMDKCLLVKSWGSNGAWGFPRGKIATAETDAECAVREVGRFVFRVLKRLCAEESSARLKTRSKKMAFFSDSELFGKDFGSLALVCHFWLDDSSAHHLLLLLTIKITTA